ncbi:MAG: peptidase M1 [Acidobacteria bacterium]|nr:MAG: peptidase M1 [Acidobacteriota bacterium]PYY23554.1 MAG: peptidase M1 [Acidobacteriota bacterium]
MKSAILLLLLFHTCVAQTTQRNRPLSNRIVHYDIDANYDPKSHTLDATEILTYKNLTGQPLSIFPFHLYLNGFQANSTFSREAHRDFPDEEWKSSYQGAIDIRKFEVVGQGDLTSRLQFVSPDDRNPNDRTVMQVQLSRPIAPGESVEFRTQFHDKFPEVVARTGYKGTFTMGAQWFPKIGVWWHGAWNCHQFHDTTEFFADFGVFDVKLTLPQDQIVGATGLQTSSANNPNGTKKLRFHAEDVHDFAWTADARYKVFEDTFTGSAGPVHIRTLMQPENAKQGSRYNAIAKRTMELFDRWYGPYPYQQLTIVDPATFRAGGMEYPTLITADTEWFIPKSFLVPEVVVVHEFGHQYWYAMVATNEFEEAWLDEGINTYTESKVMNALYGADRSLVNGKRITWGDAEEQHFSYERNPTFDPIARYAYQFASDRSYGQITYGKTDCALLTLESLIGEDTLQRALRTWFQRYRFTHPSGPDFLRTIEEVSGRDLDWYFKQAIYGTEVLDYEISSAESWPGKWYEENGDSSRDYHSEVMVHRKGEFVFPVEVEIKFDDGSHLREHWDGKDRWTRFSYDKKAKLVSAEIDPEHKVWLDVDFFNNSRLAHPDGSARRKLSNYWMTFWQVMAQVLGWLA